MGGDQGRPGSEAESRALAEASRQKQWGKPSFMKDLFLGSFHWERIHPFPRLDAAPSEAYETFRERMSAYLLEEIDPLEVDESGEFPEDVVARLAELGALGLNIPAEYGGMGLSKREYCKTSELVCSYEGSLMGFISPHQSVGVPECLKLFGTEAQKEKYLPPCARGAVSAFALTEPDVGSDPARLSTTLEEAPGGGAYLLRGVKLWCTNGVVAKYVVVMARHKESGKISAVVADMEQPGARVTHRCRFMGLRALQNAVIEFDGLRVPKEDLIGKEGMGLRIALTALNTGRLSIPFAVLGCAKKALEVSRTWAASRTQWGKPLGKHEAIGHRLSHMATTVFAMESIIELACNMADEGKYDLRLESAAAKEFNTSRAWDILDAAMQIRGGRGYEKELSLIARGETPMPVERMMRDQRVARIFEGASEIMHLMMAREAVDKHLEIAGALVEPGTPWGKMLAALPRVALFYAAWYPGRWLTWRGWFGYGEFGTAARRLRFIHRASKRLARQAFHGMLIHRAGLEHKQAFLFRWVDIALELAAMSASLSRALTMQAQGHANATEAMDTADLFCKASRRRVRKLFRDLWCNDDDAHTAHAHAVLDGEHAWLESDILTLEETEAARKARDAKQEHESAQIAE